MSRALFPLLLMMVSLPASTESLADVYSFTDADGIQHFTNHPEQAGYTLIVTMLREEGKSNRAQVQPKTGRVAEYAPHIEAAAAELGLESALVHAVITAESGYNPTAVSRTGAQGLMQLMPETAKRYAVKDSFDPVQNIRGGSRYLRDLLQLFDNDISLAVAAYNAGENAVLKYGRQIPPYRETLGYVPKVLRLYDRYRQAM